MPADYTEMILTGVYPAVVLFCTYAWQQEEETSGEQPRMPPRRRGRGRGQIPKESKGQIEGDQRSFPFRGRGRQAKDEVDELAARVNDMELVMARFESICLEKLSGFVSALEQFWRVRVDAESVQQLARVIAECWRSELMTSAVVVVFSSRIEISSR
ncbi:golgin candidate 5-like [Dorcoceras hygrometricum]|uniref:Golgin candidate 5-like n=1 Tax=Dorcoceras hygrometricum TaxID=472368 RepID=A0A2Z7DFS6_9LAMI|nr:golgin candidate 5-like [Dorcoceras hygrometricum]